ncbi:LPXTG cell wall anchor domain-containing protein [Streptomyces sp. NPDC059193]|uniref:LPXTG cell wall anchor domain-containing protein n=1 Tax=Streptomyces sp. NPDC059193 TaxID=3346763 RepID=UPI00369E42C8
MSVRTAAAIAVVAGVVTTLLPLSATAASAAPAADGNAVLRTEMGTPVPNGPLTRGGASETFDLTVKNPTGKAVTYKPWMLLDPTGPSRLQQADVVFKVDAVDAPATKSSIGQQDGEWQGMFYPASGGEGGQGGFDIPANGKMTWKVTLGLGANYPTNNGDFTLQAASYNNSVAADGMGSHLFKVGPQITTGELKTSFKQGLADMGGQEHRAYWDLNYQATGDGAFATGLSSTLALSHPGEEKADFRLQAMIDGRWQDLKAEDGRYALPEIPKGFGAASGVRTLPLRVNLGQDTKIKKKTIVTMEVEVSHASGNTFPIKFGYVQFPLTPITEPAPAPSGTPTTSPSPSATPTKAPGTSTAVQPAAATSSSAAAVGNTHTTTTGSGSLASTGSSDTGLYAGLAGVLVALGAAAAWLGARRRRATSA